MAEEQEYVDKITNFMSELIGDLVPKLSDDPYIADSTKKGMIYVDIMEDGYEEYAVDISFDQLIENFIDGNRLGDTGKISKDDAAEFLDMLRSGIKKIELRIVDTGIP